MNAAPAVADRPGRRWLPWVLVAVMLGHAIQLFSPLRLNTDAVRLLGMAWSAHTTGSYDVRGVADQYPSGYPAMVRMLLAAQLGRAFWLNFLNFAWLAAAAAGWFWMARRQFHLSRDRSLVAVLLPLLSWVTIKHAALPLSDIPYLGLSTLSLLCLQSYSQTAGRFAWPPWVAALLLALAALQVRTIGIALAGAVFLAPLFHPQLRRLLITLRTQRFLLLWLGGLSATFLGIVLWHGLMQTAWFERQFLRPGSYFSQLTTPRTGAAGPVWRTIIGYRLSEISAIVLNLPAWICSPLVYAPVAGTAIAGATWAAYRCWRSHLPLLLYAVLTMAVLLVWPSADPRFFLPLLPVASLLAVSAAPPLPVWRRFRPFALTGLGTYALLGLAALGYSVHLTLAGRELAKNYSRGAFQLTYRHAFGFAPDAPPEALDPNWLAILQHYEPRVKAAQPSP